MIVTTFPWHWVGILGMPRRMAYFDYTDPAISPATLFRSPISVFGGVHSPRVGASCFWSSSSAAQWAHERRSEPYRFARRFIRRRRCQPR